jgi:hypothetical protein
MAKYHKRLTTAQPDDEVEESHHASDGGEAYMELAARYGLHDMIIGDPDDSPQQTVEDEYHSYVTAPLSPKKVSSLKFWEVRGDVNSVKLLTRHGRLTGQHFQRCSQWRWIIFPSKRRPFLVNGSSPQVRKRTPSGGIA